MPRTRWHGIGKGLDPPRRIGWVAIHASATERAWSLFAVEKKVGLTVEM
jgi:hypothetical protein